MPRELLTYTNPLDRDLADGIALGREGLRLGGFPLALIKLAKTATRAFHMKTAISPARPETEPGGRLRPPLPYASGLLPRRPPLLA